MNPINKTDKGIEQKATLQWRVEFSESYVCGLRMKASETVGLYESTGIRTVAMCTVEHHPDLDAECEFLCNVKVVTSEHFFKTWGND